MIDNYLEPTRIISYNEGRILTKKEYTLLKRKAKIEREKIINNHKLNEDSPTTKKIIEYIINNTEYKDISPIKKEIILANAVLPDDIKIIEILTVNGFTLEHIKTIIRFRGILKNLVLTQSKLTEELKEQINIYKKVITKLIEVFSINFYTNNSTIILNRLCELLITNPQLFESMSKSKSRKLLK